MSLNSPRLGGRSIVIVVHSSSRAAHTFTSGKAPTKRDDDDDGDNDDDFVSLFLSKFLCLCRVDDCDVVVGGGGDIAMFRVFELCVLFWFEGGKKQGTWFRERRWRDKWPRLT